MPAPYEDDDDRLANLEALGDDEIIIDGRTLTGDFRDEYFGVELDEHVVQSSQPRVRVLTSDVTDVVEETPVLVNGEAYAVVEAMPDGNGMTTLRLREGP